jgi:PilZ domain
MAEGGIAKALRYLVSEGAVIKFGDRRIDCLVRNLSETGAAIEVPNQPGIPAQFELSITRLGLIMSCRVVWRKDHRIGVAFVQTLPGDGSTV